MNWFELSVKVDADESVPVSSTTIYLSDKRCVWDWIKCNIRLHAISYSKEKAKLKYEKEQRIQQELEDANRLFENDPSASNRLRLDEIKEKLEILYEEKVKGIVIRARARWHEYGERCTKYFLNLEKRNRVKKKKNTSENC